VLDHRLAAAKGGGIEEMNLLTACNKCNVRKSDAAEDEHRARHPQRRIRAKYREPATWDGFSAVFLALATNNPWAVTATERAWVAALTAPGA
jgi:5-methylcytosine-specific restriction endonuclease McrA